MRKSTKLFFIAAILLACVTTIKAQVNIDFEVTGQTWTWATFENGVNPNTFSVVPNPSTTGINTSATSAKMIVNADGARHAGVESVRGTGLVPFKFNADNSIIRMMVYKSVISPVGLKFAESNGEAQPEVLVSNTKINEWEELTFDLSGSIGKGVTGIIDQIIVFLDFPARARTAGSVCYFDNIKFGIGSMPNDTQAPTAFTATKGAVTGNSVELLLNANDNSGTVIYTITYGTTTVNTFGTSGAPKSHIITGLNKLTNYSFTIVAKDAAGNMAANNPIVVTATTTDVVIPTIATIDFETVGNAWSWTVFGNGPGGADTPANLTIPIANPNTSGINTSVNSAKFVLAPTALPWGGFFTENMGTVSITEQNKIVRVMVHKDKLSPFGVKLEGGTIGAFEILKTNLTIGAWEMLTFDFSAQLGKTFTKLVLLPDFLMPRASGGTVYIDNISFGDATTSVKHASADKLAITMFPNPALEKIYVSAKSEISEIIVRNLVGQVIKTVTVNGLQRTVELNELTAGNYFVTVKLADGQLSTQKIVKL